MFCAIGTLLNNCVFLFENLPVNKDSRIKTFYTILWALLNYLNLKTLVFSLCQTIEQVEMFEGNLIYVNYSDV